MDCPGRGVQVPGDQEITPPFRACPCPRVASWGRTPGPFQADQAQCPESVTGDFPRLLSVFLIEGRAVPRASAVVCFFNRNFCFSLTHGPKVPGPFPLANLCPRCFPSPERLVSSCLSEQVPSGWRGVPQPAGPLPEGLRDPAQSGPLPTAPPEDSWHAGVSRLQRLGNSHDIHPKCPSSAPKETPAAVSHRACSAPGRVSLAGHTSHVSRGPLRTARPSVLGVCFAAFSPNSRFVPTPEAWDGHRGHVLGSKSGF